MTRDIGFCSGRWVLFNSFIPMIALTSEGGFMGEILAKMVDVFLVKKSAAGPPWIEGPVNLENSVAACWVLAAQKLWHVTSAVGSC